MDLCGWWDASPGKYPEMVMRLNIFSSDTPWKFNIAPEGWWLQDYFPIGKVPFWGGYVKLREGKWPSPINDYFMGISPCVRHTVWCAGQRWRTWACGPLGFGCSFHLISAYAGFQKISQHMSTCDMALVRVLPDGSTVVSGMKPWCLGIEATLLPHSATILDSLSF